MTPTRIVGSHSFQKTYLHVNMKLCCAIGWTGNSIMANQRKNNDVTCFMWYVNERMTLSEMVLVCGIVGEHVYNKWVYAREHHLGDLWWYAELDEKCRQKIVDRAVSIYGEL